MTGFIVCIFSFRNRVSPKEAFEGLEPGEGNLSRPVLRGLGSREAAWPLDNRSPARIRECDLRRSHCLAARHCRFARLDRCAESRHTSHLGLLRQS